MPRSVAIFIGEVEAVHLHLFRCNADASIPAFCAVAVAIVDHE